MREWRDGAWDASIRHLVPARRADRSMVHHKAADGEKCGAAGDDQATAAEADRRAPCKVERRQSIEHGADDADGLERAVASGNDETA